MQHRTTYESLNASARIIGGMGATQAFPWFVNLQGCGGVLIAPHIVLTAGHCANEGIRLVGTKVRIGSLWNQKGGEERTVKRVIIHPRFTIQRHEYVTNDLAILVLNAPSTKEPLRIAPTPPVIGETIHYIGFGLTKERPSLPDWSLIPSRLQQGFGRRISVTDAIRLFTNPQEKKQIQEPGFIAVESPTQTACVGDSGGPAFVIRNGVPYLTGIVSWGPKDCKTVAQDRRVFAISDISMYLPWIQSIH